MKDCVQQQVGFWFSPAGGASIALIGVAITAFATMWLSGRARRWHLQDERRDRCIARGEEVYSLIRNWHMAQNPSFLYYRLAMKGQIDYNTALDAVIKSGTGQDLKVERIDLILAVYFCNVANCWDEALAAAKHATKIEGDFRALYKEGCTSSELHLRDFEQASVLAERKIETTLSMLSSEIQRIAQT
jgi:hypothetical protein